MTAKRTMAAMLIGVALLPLQAAQACEFSRTPWGLRVLNCKLSDLTGGRFVGDISLSPDQGGRIPLPNLVVTDVDTTIVGSSANLSVQLGNIGRLNAGAFEVQLIATITDPLNGGSPFSMTALPPVSVPGLAVGAGATAFPGAVSLPNRTQDWDVCTIAIVDPPPMGRASWGNVVESNESDNQWPMPMQQGCCRAYGKNPDLSGPPACS
jgi:hypothetical protein